MAFAAVDNRNRVGRWQLGVVVASGAAASGATSVFVSYAAEKSPTMQLRGTVQTGRQAPAWSDADGPKWNLVAASAAASGIVACGAAIAERRARQPKVCIQANSQPTQGAGRSAAVPFLLAAPGLTNNPLDTTFPGDLGFDPLGFSSETDSPFYEVDTYLSEVCENSGLPAFEKMRWYREAELMHGRVAMLATVNIFARELGEVVLPEQGLDIGGRLQFLEVMAVFEAYRGYRLLVNTEALAGDLGIGMGPGGPMASGMSLEELAAKQCRELQNGRLAMLAVVGMAVQEVNNGYFIARNDELQTLKNTVSTLPGTNPLNTVLGAVGMLVALDGIRRLSTPEAITGGQNSIAQKAINPFAIAYGMQSPPVPLPNGVIAGGLPQSFALSEEQVVQFEEDGVIMIKGGMKPWVEFLRAVTQHQIEHPHVWSLVGRMSGLYDYIQRNTWMTNDGFRDFLYYSPLGHIASQLARTPEVRVSTDMLLVNPNKGFGWHQDNQNGPIDFPEAIRWWVAMDRCGEDNFGAPEYLLGSHKNTSVSKEAVFVTPESGDLPKYTRSTTYQPEPGDLILWDSRTIHRILAPPGQSWEEGTQRRALGGTLAKSGATYLNKGGASAISDLAGHTRVNGEALGGAYFPRIYPTRVPEEEALRSTGSIEGRSTKKIMDLGVSLVSNAGKYISFSKVVGKKK